MVQGNWQRRIEKANQRKAAAKEKKELRSAGLLVEPLDVLNALFRLDDDPEVWVYAADSARKLCRAYFRFEDCPNRRCKWSHAETLRCAPCCAVPAAAEATVRAVVRTTRVDEALRPREDAVAPPAEDAPRSSLEGLAEAILELCLEYAPAAAAVAGASRRLRAASLGSPAVAAAKAARRPALVLARQRAFLRRAASVAFAATGATLAYEAADDDVWRSFAAARGGPPRPRARSRGESFAGDAESPSRALPPERSFLADLHADGVGDGALRRVFAFCPAPSLAGCSRALRAAAKADPSMRARRRAGLELQAARKKATKRKKAAKKAGKKDGFARGQ